MNVRLSGRLCLTPRLLGAAGGGERRVEGVLDVPGGAGAARTCRFVDAVRYDGHRCRYRVRADAAGAADWVCDDDASAYRPFSRLVVERLCTIARGWEPRLHRFPDAPPSRALTRRLRRIGAPYELSVLDTAVTTDGRLWLRAALHSDRAVGWKACHRAGDRRVTGWLPLTEPTRSNAPAPVGAPRAVADAPAAVVPAASVPAAGAVSHRRAGRRRSVCPATRRASADRRTRRRRRAATRRAGA